MSLVTDAQIEHALKCLQDWNAGKARAAHEYLDDYTKVLVAQLGEQANDAKSQAARADFALRHPDYAAHLIQKRAAAELDYMHRQRIAASAAIIDLYRTQEASNRKAERL